MRSSDSFGRVSRIAIAIAHQRPDAMPVEPLGHFRTTGAFRVEADWNLPGSPPLGKIKITADRNLVAIDFKTDRAMTLEQARDAAKVYARAIAAASEIQRIITER